MFDFLCAFISFSYRHFWGAVKVCWNCRSLCHFFLFLSFVVAIVISVVACHFSSDMSDVVAVKIDWIHVMVSWTNPYSTSEAIIGASTHYLSIFSQLCSSLTSVAARNAIASSLTSNQVKAFTIPGSKSRTATTDAICGTSFGNIANDSIDIPYDMASPEQSAIETPDASFDIVA